MDHGIITLLFGLAAVGLIWAAPMVWLKAAGGLLLIATLFSMLTDAGRMLVG